MTRNASRTRYEFLTGAAVIATVAVIYVYLAVGLVQYTV